MSDGPSEGERSTAYDTWGPICVICGAPPRDPTYGELANGKTKSRIALHHADGDRTWNIPGNLFPICERADGEANGCHSKIHHGNGSSIHHVFSRRLLGHVSGAEIVAVAKLVSEQHTSLTYEEKQRAVDAITAYGQPLTDDAVERLRTGTPPTEREKPSIA